MKMSEPNTITINEVKYVRADSVAPRSGPIKIVVLDRGYVYVGGVEIKDDFVTITEASCIRRWGTTKGLGELVNGPTANTILEKTGTVKAPLRALISMIDVEQEKWSRI
jgi:hypothetical protein